MDKIPLIQRVLTFACSDPVDLYRYSTVCEAWAETASKYAKLSDKFEVITERTIAALGRGSNGVFDAFLIATRSFEPREFDDSFASRRGLGDDTTKTIAMSSSTKTALNISKFQRLEVIEILKWMGLSTYLICYLTAWHGNKLIYDLLIDEVDTDYDYYELEKLDYYVEVDWAFRQTGISGAIIRSGRIDMVREIPSIYIDSGGFGYTEYDIASLSGNREMVWLILRRDVETEWKHRQDDQHEMFEIDSYNLSRPYSSHCSDTNPEIIRAHEFMHYLGQANELPYRGPDENDEWERAKFEELFEDYPNWFAVQTLLVFKKKHFYDIIEKNIHRISPGEQVTELFFQARIEWFEDRTDDLKDDMEYDWFRQLLIEKRPDLNLSIVLKDNPDVSFIDCL